MHVHVEAQYNRPHYKTHCSRFAWRAGKNSPECLNQDNFANTDILLMFQHNSRAPIFKDYAYNRPTGST